MIDAPCAHCKKPFGDVLAHVCTPAVEAERAAMVRAWTERLPKDAPKPPPRMHAGRVLRMFLAGMSTAELCRAFCCTQGEIEEAIRRQQRRTRRKR